MNEYITLNDIDTGERAAVESLNSLGDMRRRLLDLGLVDGTVVECVGKSPAGDPAAYLIRGAVIALRSEDSRNVSVRKV